MVPETVGKGHQKTEPFLQIEHCEIFSHLIVLICHPVIDLGGANHPDTGVQKLLTENDSLFAAHFDQEFATVVSDSLYEIEKVERSNSFQEHQN